MRERGRKKERERERELNTMNNLRTEIFIISDIDFKGDIFAS